MSITYKSTPVENLNNSITGEETMEELRLYNEHIQTQYDTLLNIWKVPEAMRLSWTFIKKNTEKSEWNCNMDECWDNNVKIKQYSNELQKMIEELVRLYKQTIELSIKIMKQKKKEM